MLAPRSGRADVSRRLASNPAITLWFACDGLQLSRRYSATTIKTARNLFRVILGNSKSKHRSIRWRNRNRGSSTTNDRVEPFLAHRFSYRTSKCVRYQLQLPKVIANTEYKEAAQLFEAESLSVPYSRIYMTTIKGDGERTAILLDDSAENRDEEGDPVLWATNCSSVVPERKFTPPESRIRDSLTY
ncbi:hypothetical protein EVAR_42989_1 [Eumeta japonica]|uniref:Uncharacterized protein n=1 Tax=Eumeta variegata TaxID=151549 RepID=A0A4C1WCR4_EUMVA|nr:hypothetical protein EVAR_42989_1 [Eumeta japonica]